MTLEDYFIAPGRCFSLKLLLAIDGQFYALSLWGFPQGKYTQSEQSARGEHFPRIVSNLASPHILLSRHWKELEPPKAHPDKALSPSKLAKKMLCVAYSPAPFNEGERLKFLGKHAVAALGVITRHTGMGYILTSVERAGNGWRIDLLFLRILPSPRIRLVEVKSSRVIRLVHKIQAALYHPVSAADEVVVSSGERDELLSSDFIRQTLVQAETTRQFLASDPALAARTYTPHPDACYTCGNASCPFLRDLEARPTKKEDRAT